MSNKIDFNQIEEIRNKADIVSIISKYIKLSRRGANYFGICPFHADHNPSLVVSPSKKIWKCFVCGAKGNVFTFVQKYKKISFLEAVKEVAAETGFDVSKLSFINNNVSFLNPERKRLVEANAYVNDLYKSFLTDPKNSKYLEYLKNRGLNEETIKFFEFGYAPKEDDLIYNILTNNNNFLGSQRSSELTWNEKELLDAGIIYLNEEEKPVDFLIDRITIPIYDNNNYVVGFSGRTTGNSSTKYLNTGSTKVFSKGNLLFNFNRVRELNDKRVIIVEGFMDAIALYNCGHKNVLATMGVALTDKHLNLLNSLELDTVILCFDNDNAGQLATIENGRKLMSNGFNVYVIGKYDKQNKDVDELMQHKGKTSVDQIIDTRRDFISYLIDIKLSNQKSLDEIQSNINYVLKEMADCGDVLLRTKHFELIEQLTGIKVNDLQIKFNEFNKQPTRYSNQIKNYNPPRKNQNFNFELEQKQAIEIDNSSKEDLKKSVDISLKMSGQLVLSRVLNATRSLIAFLLNHNEFIDRAYNDDLSFGKYFINLPEIKIFNNLSYLLSKDGSVTLDSLMLHLPNIDKEIFSQIAQDDEFTFSKKTDKKRLVNKYASLLKTISTSKANYIKWCKINETLTSDADTRDQKIKQLVDINQTIKSKKN